jgi:Fur family zinc uptake transcriptional regulator
MLYRTMMADNIHALRPSAVLPERTIETRLRDAAGRCAARGERLTALRRDVLRLILAADRPIRAYALINQLAHAGRAKVGPPTVYRTLDFLLEHELIHRIESACAFIACPDSDAPHCAQFVICDGCGAATELHDDGLARALQRRSRSLGFTVTRQIIEARGLCPSCQTEPRP